MWDGTNKIHTYNASLITEDGHQFVATEIPAKMIPEGRTIDIVQTNGNTVNVYLAKQAEPEVTEPEAPKARFIRVEYVNAAGAIVATERQKVEYGKLAMTVTAPKGYNLFDPNNVISIDDNTKTVKVTVVKEIVEPEVTEPEAPKARFIRVEYVNAAGAVVATERQKVEYGKLAMTVTPPEGYNLFDTNNVISIDDETKTVQVLVVKKSVEPEVTEPEATKPEATEPEATKPEATKPEATKPESPKDNVPHTGDDTNMVMWMTLSVVSLLGAVGVFLGMKKKSTK